MTDYLDNKFNALKKEIVEEHESISDKLDKKHTQHRIRISTQNQQIPIRPQP